MEAWAAVRAAAALRGRASLPLGRAPWGALSKAGQGSIVHRGAVLPVGPATHRRTAGWAGTAARNSPRNSLCNRGCNSQRRNSRCRSSPRNNRARSGRTRRRPPRHDRCLSAWPPSCSSATTRPSPQASGHAPAPRRRRRRRGPVAAPPPPPSSLPLGALRLRLLLPLHLHLQLQLSLFIQQGLYNLWPQAPPQPQPSRRRQRSPLWLPRAALLQALP